MLSEQRKIFNPRKNSLLQRCAYRLFLLYERRNVIGRIAAFIDLQANAYRSETIGSFGHYECIERAEASRLLLQTAEAWLKRKGMTHLRGPWNFVSQDMGLITEGFELSPVIMSSYNPPYYNEQLLGFGMKKIKDLLVYNCDTSKGYQIPERYLRFSEHLHSGLPITVRPLNMKNLAADAHIIVRLTNESLKNNWGFYPIPESEAEAIAADLKPVVHPEAVLIAEVNGEPIGYLIALPDVNALLNGLNGRLFPLGIFKLFRGIKKIKRYRIWALGILRPWQKKGISVLLFQHLNQALASRGVYIEANWILEDNALMNNALKNLKLNLVKRYRIYQKEMS